MSDIAEAFVALRQSGIASRAVVENLARELLRHERIRWEARCHFCAGPSYAWMTDDATWALVEPVLGQEQACFECFGAAWMIMGLNDGEPFVVQHA